MSDENKIDLVALGIPYRYDLGSRGDCGISYFVNNDFYQSLLGIQYGGVTNHQGLRIGDAQTRVLSEYNGNVLPSAAQRFCIALKADFQ